MAVEIPVVVNIDKAFEDAAKRVGVAMQPLQSAIEGLTSDLGAWREILNESKINSKDFIEAAKNIQNISERLAEAEYAMKKYTENEGSIRSMTSSLAELERKWAEMGSAQKFTDSGGKNLSADAQSLLSQYKNITAEIEKQGKSLAQLAAEESRINKLKQQGAQSRRYDTAILQSNIKTIRVLSEQQRILSEQLQRTPIGSEQYKVLATRLREVQKELQKAQKDLNGASSSMRNFGSASNSARASIDATNSSLRRQSGLFSQLKSLAGMYVSVFGGLRFIKNIRETTAELELQRVALGGILQDTDRATELFREIKAAALKSPFEIKDLVTYTKQLSAYRIETDKLFDVTMRLADVSAGLGVDMSRLILAYGQVRAASVLRGQELRQFTEAGIPLVELLADKFQKLGREGTTVADVFDLISKRAVPFSMIEEIFNDMTDAGGMFYKMQEKQSETLKGQWMKLRDAATIMYDEIGNTQQVHKAMEDLLQSALSLTRNWREVARWVATGTASLVAYSTVSKAAAIASSALAKADAMRLAVSKKQVVAMPKVLAAIVGETTAKEWNRKATKRLTIAQYKLAAANGLLEKTFWKVAVAIMKNPYAAAAAGIAAVGFAIYTLVKNSKEAEVSVESLNSAIAKVNNAASSLAETRRLIDVYEELSAKAEKSAEEQAKLSRVTRELAKSFPSAVNGLNAQGEALDINIEKVKALSEVEAKLAEQRLKRQAEEAKTQLGSLEAEAKRISNNIMQVTEHGGLYLGKNLKGENVIKTVSEEQLEKWGERLREITQLIYDYKTALAKLEESEFIGPMPQKTDETTQNLSEWKKAIARIQDEKVKAGATPIFTPDDIQKFESVLQFSKKLKEKYDEVNQSLKTNRELLKSATDATRADIEANIKADEQTLKMIEAIKTALGILFKTTAPRDTRLSQLKSDISELANAYKKFKELTKYKGEESALSDINKMFPQLEGWTPTKDNLVKRLNEMLDKVKSDLARSPKSKTLLDMKRALETEISNLEFDDLKDKIETKLKNLQDEIKRSETARNFFNDILDLTGDEKLATTMSIEVYGGLGNNFKERLQHQLDTILESLDASKITDELRDAFAKQNFSVIMENLDKIPEAWHKELKDMADSTQKFSADQIQAWLKELQGVKTYAEQRVEIERKAQQRISEIRASDIDQATKSDLIAKYQRKQAEDVAKAQYEAFKNSPLYVQMFDSLDNASERVLRLMRERIAEMMASWKDLDPVQLKEMQSRLNEIDKQLATRNPFKVLSDSIKRYNDLMKSGRSRLGDETAAVEADAELKKQKELLETELKKLTAKRATLDATRKNKSANQGAVLAAEYEVKIQENVVEEQQENVNLAEKAANETARQAEEWKDIADLIGASSKTFQEYYGIFEQLEETIEQAFSIFLTDELADKVRRTKDIINSLASAIQNIAKAAASASAGDAAGAASSGFSGFFNIVSVGMQIADMIGQIRLDAWNKQIETQDRLIQALERSYSRLENVMNKSFGTDYIYNYTEAVKALEATQEAYNKQLETSKEKEKEASKQEDREAAAQQSAQIEQNIQDTSEKLRELEEQMQEFYTGSSLSAAAQEFASAWLEAYREFGSTSEAIKERMQDMINNLIVKASLAKVAEQILEPFYDALADSAKAGTMTEDISMLIDMLNGKVGELNTGLNAMGQVLQSAGISLRGTVGSFRGISRDIAGASEEAILGLSAGINTQNFYMSAIHEDVSRIAAMLLGETESTNNAVPPTSASTGAEMKTVQELANIHLPHMDSTLSSIYELLTRVIKANGTTATHYVSVRM